MSTRKVLNEFFGLAEVEAVGGAQGIRISGDRETLGALQDALQEAEHAEGVDPDVAAWAGKAWKAVAQGAARGGQNISLPRFESAPDDLMPDDDSGSVEGEEGGF